MMSDQEITSVIAELGEAIWGVSNQKFVPGLVGILIDAHRALNQLMSEVPGESTQNLPEKTNGQIILIHGMDLGSSGVTSCCGRPPFELPTTDRLTLNPDALRVTCKGPKND